MRRALKITVLATLVTTLVAAVALVVVLERLVRSEAGSRWLLEQGIALVPETIEAGGISGTLAEGLKLDTLHVRLPDSEIRAREIEISWSPSKLLARVIDINSVRIGELDIELLESGNNAEPADDPLFWLQIPLDVAIDSGRIDVLRIETVEFSDVSVAGSIGRGRLEIEALDAQSAGIRLQAGGKLAGPAPGRLRAKVDWELPTENLAGNGSFDGSIEALNFTQVIEVPETVNFKGTIRDLFTAPSLTGVAQWSSVRVPGEVLLSSTDGRVEVASDFRSAQLQGGSILQLEGWPSAPVRAEARVDPQSVTLDSYTLDALNGEVSGSGRIEYGDGLSGRIQVHASAIDTALIHSELPGRLGLDGTLQIESADAFIIDVTDARASIAGTEYIGVGRAHWRNAGIAAVDASIGAGRNRLTADVELGRRLAGVIRADAPEPGILWPGLRGALDATVVLDGSMEQPQARMAVNASSLSFDAWSLETLTLTAELQEDNRIAGELTAAGLQTGARQIGTLAVSLSGSVAEHSATMSLREGPVDAVLRASGGWDGEYLTERIVSGSVQPDGFERWRLLQNPRLRLSAADGRLDAHCWKQQQAAVCIEDSHWDANSLQSRIAINDFALATLQPLLPEGLSVDGAVNADLELVRDGRGLRGELRWRQSRTLLNYADSVYDFQTVLEEVTIDAVADANQSRLTAKLTGEQGLSMTATAGVDGALSADSPLQAEASGRLPNIELLRPLVQQALKPGELGGVLTVDLDVDGTLGEPQFTGGAHLSDGWLGLPAAGVTLRDINIAAQSRGADRLQVSGGLRSGDGSAEITGAIRAVKDAGLQANIRIQGQDLATVREPDLSVDTSPDLKLTIGEGVFDISGTLLIPRATAQIRDLPKSAVPASTDVVVHMPEGALEQQQGTIITGNIEVVLGEDVRFTGFGLTSRLVGELRLTQSRGEFLRSGGTVRVQDGYLTGYGKELRVDRGELTFTGPLDDPLINIQVSRETIYDGRLYTIGLRLTGTARHIKTEPFSRPSMSDRDVLSFLLLDRPATSDSDASGAALALGLQQLLPDQSGILGLDEVGFETNEANEAAVVAGKRINERLVVRYVFGSQGASGLFRIRYTLGHGFSLEASTGSSQSMDLIYILER